MAIKDFNNAEDQAHGAKEGNNKLAKNNSAPNDADLSQNTEIKNAHASGDGSYGRSDESLPEETQSEKRDADTY